MIFSVRQDAPEGSTFARHAFDASLGKVLPLKFLDEQIGEATLIGAVPDDGLRAVTLTYRVEAIAAEFVDTLGGTLLFDEFVPPDAYNPAAAVRKAQEWDYTENVRGPM